MNITEVVMIAQIQGAIIWGTPSVLPGLLIE